MSGFLDLEGIDVPRSAIEEANNHLREVGDVGLEGFSLWAGKRSGRRFQVLQNIVPRQTGHQTRSGLLVQVGPEELHRINVWLYENQMTLIAQLHSHPSDAYHSDTDDTFPIATTEGSLSIVIPNFAMQAFRLRNCAVYRLFPGQGWVSMTPLEAETFISIVD